MRLRSLAFAALSAGTLAACQSAPEAPPSPVTLAVDWGATRPCFETASPILTVGNVPPGTVKLGFRMTDRNAPQFNHGGGTVAFSGQSTIPAGTFSYRGPCPQLNAHTYRWTVDAVDGEGNVLAKGQTELPFPQDGTPLAPVPAAAPAATAD